MKFSGELKFPEIDHPGVPITFVIDGTQAELIVEGESLGRWSLYDIHARRLVASAFQIDLDGDEVTFVADDPIDFAYRGVEHMAETWATMKSKRMGARSMAVRKSRRDTTPSRIEEMKEAMEANLHAQWVPRQIAGEEAMPEASGSRTGQATDETTVTRRDTRDQAASMPVASPHATDGEIAEDAPLPAEDLTEAARLLEEEKQRIADERARLEEERRTAEQREADRIEAFRLEMKRLETEREEVRRQAAELAERSAQTAPGPVVAEPEPEPAAAEPEPEPEPEPVMVEPEPEPEPEPVMVEPEPEPEPEPVLAASAPVVDLSDLEKPTTPVIDHDTRAPRHLGEQQPAMAGANKEKSGGLMGAVRAAFRSSSRDHEHQFIEAPGGIGITRYVCEECGYVSISA